MAAAPPTKTVPMPTAQQDAQKKKPITVGCYVKVLLDTHWRARYEVLRIKVNSKKKTRVFIFSPISFRGAWVNVDTLERDDAADPIGDYRARNLDDSAC